MSQFFTYAILTATVGSAGLRRIGGAQRAKAAQVNLGFRPDHIFLATVDPSLQRYAVSAAGSFKRSCSTSCAPCRV